MEQKYISPQDLEEYAAAMMYVQQPRLVRFLGWVLKRVSFVLGYPVYIALPQEIINMKDSPEQLRALRIVKKLQQEGYITQSYYLTSQQSDYPLSQILIHEIKTAVQDIGWSGKAAHLTSREYLQWPALGEALERYSLQSPYSTPGELLSSSYAKLKKPKADIFTLTSFSDAERQQTYNDCSLQYDDQSIFVWARAKDALTGKTVYAPWQWFSFQHIHKIIGGQSAKIEPLLSPPITTGAAAGQTLTDALYVALLEIIERDAFMIYWHQQLPARRIDVSTIENPELQQLLTLAVKYQLELHVLYLETDAPVHTVCLVVLDRTGIGQAVSIDSKSGFDITAVIVDLLQDQLAQKESLDNIWHFNKELQNTPPEKLGLVERILYWHKPERLDDIAYFISGEICTLNDLPSFQVGDSKTEQLEYLYDWFRKKNYPVYYKEIITPELKRLTEGVSVVMVRVPQMQPLYVGERFKATGGARLKEVARSLGYTSDKHQSGNYCTIPSPFI